MVLFPGDDEEQMAACIAQWWVQGEWVAAAKQYVEEEVSKELATHAIDALFLPSSPITSLLRGAAVAWLFESAVFQDRGEFRSEDSASLTVAEYERLSSGLGRKIVAGVCKTLSDLPLPDDLAVTEHFLVGYDQDAGTVSVLVMAQYSDGTEPRAWGATYPIDSDGSPTISEQSLEQIDLEDLDEPAPAPERTPEPAAPRASVSPLAGPVGTEFTVRWTGLTPDGEFVSQLHGPNRSSSVTFTADQDGAYAHVIESRTFEPGIYQISGFDPTTRLSSNVVSFEVTAEEDTATPAPISTPVPTTAPTPAPTASSLTCASLRVAAATLVPGTDAYRANISGQVTLGCALYMSGDSALYLVDTLSGAWTEVGGYGLNTGMFDVALAPDGTMYGVAHGGSEFVTIDRWTGATTDVGPTGANLNGLTVARDGTIYGSDTSALYTLDPKSGASTLVGSTGSLGSAGDLAMTAAGVMYFAANVLATIDPTSGATSAVGSTSYSCLWGLSATPAGLFGGTCNGELLKIDPATGSFTIIASGLPAWYGTQ